MFTNFRGVIDAWPDLSAFAHDAEVPYGTAKQWRNRNSIPSAHWLNIAAGAERRAIKGVSLEVLASLAESRRATGEAAVA